MNDLIESEERSEDVVMSVPEPGVPLETEKGKFRLQNQFILLTYREHLHKDDYKTWFMDKIPSAQWVRLAHETGDSSCPYMHTHVVADLGKTFQTTNCRFFDYEIFVGEDEEDEAVESIHPHIRKLVGKKAFEDAKTYIAKEDPENSDLKAKENWIEGVLGCRTTVDALKKYAKKPSDVTGIIALHGLKKLDFRTGPKKEFIPRIWQKEMHDELMQPPDDRTITWIVDEEGGSGKTAFGRWMSREYPDDFIFTTDLGTSRDAATIIYNALVSGWTSKGIFINLSRTAEHHDRMYSYIEEIKDGVITATKYQGKAMDFEPPHVVIFANWMPKIHNLSPDRWRIRRIKQDEDGEYIISKPIKIKRKIVIKHPDETGFTSSVPNDSGERNEETD